MNRGYFSSALLATFLVACASEPPPPAAPPPPPPAPAPVAVAPPADTTPPPPPEPTPEEKKKAQQAAELQAERTEWDAKNKAEVARWTPEMHTAAKALAEKSFPNAKAAVQAAEKGQHRAPGDAERDKYRHPDATMEFFGLKPTMTVVDVGPGEGWYTELLAPVLEKKGKYIATGGDPNGPAESRGAFYAQKYQGFLARSPELYGKVQTVVVDGKAPKLNLDGQVDMVLLMREVHGMVNNDTLGAWLAEIHNALKPGGIVGVEEHRAKPDADPKVSSKDGYVPEKWLIQQFEAAGFKLAGKSEINANPKDTKDYPKGVWTLPPSFELKEQDHDKYAAIGESDRMTLKFVKAPAKAEASTKEGAAKKEGAPKKDAAPAAAAPAPKK